MVPTLIASFYGMNVDIHLDTIPHAFAIIVLSSVFLSALAFVIFKESNGFKTVPVARHPVGYNSTDDKAKAINRNCGTVLLSRITLVVIPIIA